MLRKSHLISGTSNIFMARVGIYRFRSVRTVRTDERGIRSLKRSLRSVKCARFTLAIIGSL